jgi:hypothetical protein
MCARCKPEEDCVPGSHCAHSSLAFGHTLRLRQMVLQYLSNAGSEGAKRDSIYEYLKDVLPQNKTEEQKIRMLGDLLKNMSKEYLIKAEGRTWYVMPQS